MEELLKALSSNEVVNKLSAQTGIESNQVISVVTAALPQILDAVKGGAQQGQGGGLDLGGLLSAVTGGGKGGDLSSLFGGNLGNIVSAVSSKTGVESGGVIQILGSLAPLVLGYLSNSGKQGGIAGMVTSFLDKDKDGSVMDDLGDMLGGFLKK